MARGVVVLQDHAKIKHHIYTALSPKSSGTELEELDKEVDENHMVDIFGELEDCNIHVCML